MLKYRIKGSKGGKQGMTRIFALDDNTKKERGNCVMKRERQVAPGHTPPSSDLMCPHMSHKKKEFGENNFSVTNIIIFLYKKNL